MAEGELPATRLDSQRGMTTLFSMTNGFVNHVIQQKTIGDFIEDNDILSFSAFTSVPWQDYIYFGMGFVVCAGIGVLLAFILPISGCGVGCARCCTCCCSCCGGRKRYHQVGKRSRSKEYGCSGCLLVVTATLLASVVCSFLVTEMYRKELDPKTGFLEDILRGVKAVDSYVNNTAQELNVTAVSGIQGAIAGVYDVIDRMPNETRDRLGDDTQVRPALYGLAYFANNMSVLNASLGGMDVNTQILEVQLTQLENNLTVSRTSIQPLLERCINDTVARPQCQSALNDLQNLTVCSDLSGVGNVTRAQTAVQVAIGSDVTDHINSGVRAFENISQVVERALDSEMGDIKKTLEDVEDEVVSAMNDLTSQLDMISLDSAIDGIISAKPYLEEYGHYAYAGLVSLNALMLLIVVLLLLGVVTGCCCRPPMDKSKTCDATSMHGARLLLSASGLTFFFSWVITIIVIVLFVTGGAMETMVCRHILPYDTSMEKIENILWNEFGDIGFNLSLKNTMEECKQNSSLYQAVEAEKNGLNISSILDLDKYGVYDMINKLNNTNITIDPVQIYDPSMNTTLTPLDTELKSIDFDGYNAELAKHITCIGLNDYAASLREISVLVQNPLRQQLVDEADKLDTIYRNDVSQVNSTKTLLQDDVNTSNTIYAKSLVSLVDELATAETELNAEANDIIKEQISIYGTEILGHITGFTSTVEHVLRSELGACRSLYDAGVKMVYAPCVYFLDPLNAIWFCYGWFLILAIPALIMAIQLADIFRTLVPKEQPGVDRIELPPMGDSQHYPLYYSAKGPTQHHGVRDNKVYPATPQYSGQQRRMSPNNVYPTDSYQAPPAHFAGGYSRPQPPTGSAYAPRQQPHHRDLHDQDYFRS